MQSLSAHLHNHLSLTITLAVTLHTHSVCTQVFTAHRHSLRKWSKKEEDSRESDDKKQTLVSQPRNACVQTATATLTSRTGRTKVLTASLFHRCFSALPGRRQMGYWPTLHFSLTLPTPDTRICTHRCTISIWP